MSKAYDVVVFGATGYTGEYTVDEVARVAKEENFTWAIAGKNMGKLQTVLSKSSARVGFDIQEIPILIADTSSYKSLVEMAQQCKIVLNCVGPYHFHGEAVVKACIEGEANHLDLSGEPQYLEKMQLLYNQKAKEKGVMIIGATGFDSIPTEMGISYAKQQFKGDVNNVESYLSLSGPDGLSFNIGTFESMVHMFANWREIKSVRKSLFPEPLPAVQYPLPKRSAIFYSDKVDKWCLRFDGDDNTAVTRTMRDLLVTNRAKKPFEFKPYICMDTFPQLIMSVLMLAIVGIMAQFSFGRSLLVKYPHIFTFGAFKRDGPTKKQVASSSFSMTFISHGYQESNTKSDKKPDKVVTTKVMGPEAAYVSTPKCMVQCAVTLMKEPENIYHKGGVFSAGSVFEGTSLIERLNKHGVTFTTVTDEKA